MAAAKKDSSRLTAQLETILQAIDVLALEQPADAIYGSLRATLEQSRRSIAQTTLIASHALALGHTVVTTTSANFDGSKIFASRLATVTSIAPLAAATHAHSGNPNCRVLPGTSRSWITTKDDDMSIKREDLDASRVDFADVGTGSGCRLSTRRNSA